MRSFFTSICFACFLAGFAQPSALPDDFLSSTFHRDRRQKLREQMPPNSVAVFFASAERNRANDVDFKYHQDPDFYYLTGYREANSVLLIFKEKQINSTGSSYDEIIFVQPRNAREEMWTGRRLGDRGVHDNLGFAMAFNNSEFKKYPINFTKFNSVLFFDFKNDVRNDPADSSDLFDLITQFKAKSNYPESKALSVGREPAKVNLDAEGLGPIMNQLRGIKTPDELTLLRKAILISCQSQIEVMRALKPGMSEMEIQGIHEYIFKRYQAEDVGYPSIVGAGQNGCILHYEENYKPHVGGSELILMDLGAEYHGYSADITRTIPVNGKFSPDQKQIYELVLGAQEEAMRLCKPGTRFQDLGLATHAYVNKGLKELGIIKTESEPNLYYPHGCCHHIGLDVHDRGNYDFLQENMTITIEPGIYIPENSACDKRWWGIGVRIEDDYLVTRDGCELLSKLAPRAVTEVEEMMKQPSPLDGLVLPDLDKKN
jgi:Xaa-Pro aminopeptidase